MQIIDEVQLDFSDVLIKPRRSSLESRSLVNITRDYYFNHSQKTTVGTGIMQSNMGTIGTFEVSRKMLANGLFACLHKHHNIEDLIKFYGSLNDDEYDRCFLSIGLRDKGVEKLEALYKEFDSVPPICIDVPNAYIPSVKNLVVKMRKTYPLSVIMVGNVVTGDITEDFILSGADIVKVGIGNGAQCLTRKQTGCGRPQFSAIVECADAAHQVGGKICSDGGITCPGDIGKAFGAGADFVMIGSLFAGTDEAEGEIVTKYYHNGEYNKIDIDKIAYRFEPHIIEKKFKQFYGMSSTLAQEKFGNGKPSYRASEGRVTLVPYAGPIDEVIEEFLGGLRSTMTYVGAKRLKDIPKQSVFYKVYHQLNQTYENTTIGK